MYVLAFSLYSFLLKLLFGSRFVPSIIAVDCLLYRAMVSSQHSGSRSRSRSRSRGVRNLRARAHAERSGHEARPGDDAWVRKVHRKSADMMQTNSSQDHH